MSIFKAWINRIAAALPEKRMRPSQHLAAAVTVLLVAATGIAPPAWSQPVIGALPIEAQSVIAQVKEAAQARDFNALRALMSDDFKWNLGPDGESRALAIEAWRRDQTYLTQLSEVLHQGCRPYEAESVVCPGNGGLDFRAGFRKTDAGWRMTYFLAGD